MDKFYPIYRDGKWITRSDESVELREKAVVESQKTVEIEEGAQEIDGKNRVGEAVVVLTCLSVLVVGSVAMAYQFALFLRDLIL